MYCKAKVNCYWCMHHQYLLLYYVVVGFASQNILECFNSSESLNFLSGGRRTADWMLSVKRFKKCRIYVRRTDSRLEYGVKIRRRGSLDRTGLRNRRFSIFLVFGTT